MRLFILRARLYAAVFIVFLAGCVQTTTIPGVARAGDTITLGLGGIQRNWGGEKPKNMEIVLTDAAAQTASLRPGVIFQAYPDYRSGVTALALGGQDGLKLVPYDGGWFVTVTLPSSVAVGAATISVDADNLNIALDDEGQPFLQEGNLTSIPIEIIPGVSSTSNSQQFDAYDNRGSHFLVRPASTTAAMLGGAYYAIDYQSLAGFEEQLPVVFPASHNPFVKINYRVQANTDGSGTYHVYVHNASGFTDSLPRQAKQAAVRDLSVHFEYFELGAETAAKANFSLDVSKSYFIDIDGNKVNTLLPEMTHEQDL